MIRAVTVALGVLALGPMASGGTSQASEIVSESQALAIARESASELVQDSLRILGTGDWAFHFEFHRASDGEVIPLSSHRVTALVRPASTLKLFTSWASYRKGTKPAAYLGKMLKESDNEMAASTLVSLGGLSALKAFLNSEGLGLSSANFAPVDGSGLSYSNRVSVSAEIALLRHILAHSDYLKFRELLAKPLEREGTLEERLGELEGRVFAKTGTLLRVVNSSLAGFVDVRGGTLVFVILGNEIPRAIERAREAVDDVVRLHVRQMN